MLYSLVLCFRYERYCYTNTINAGYGQAAVESLCREAFCAVTVVALLTTWRAQGSLGFFAQVLVSCLVPRPFFLSLCIAPVSDNTVATSPVLAKTFEGPSATSWIGVKVSFSVLLWNGVLGVCTLEVSHEVPTQLFQHKTEMSVKCLISWVRINHFNEERQLLKKNTTVFIISPAVYCLLKIKCSDTSTFFFPVVQLVCHNLLFR